MVAIPRNRWSRSIVTAGRDQSECLVAIARCAQSANIKPTDIFEEIWTRELTDLIWEAERWRRHLASFLNAAMLPRLESLLEELLVGRGPPSSAFRDKIRHPSTCKAQAAELARGWTSGDPEAIEKVEELLASNSLSMDSVRAQATAKQIETVERLNRLIASAEVRRNSLLREIDRRRTLFAERVRRCVTHIEMGMAASSPVPQQPQIEQTAPAPLPEPERRAA